jgi:signal transduction histidine kinase
MPKPAGRRGFPWLPAGLAFFTFALTGLAWWANYETSREAELRTIGTAADAARASLAGELDAAQRGLTQLAAIWSLRSSEDTAALRREDEAMLLIQTVEDLKVVARVDPSRPEPLLLATQLQAPQEAQDPQLAGLLAEAKRRSGDDHMSAAAIGGARYALYVPFTASGRPEVLAAIVDLADWAAEVAGAAGGYALSVEGLGTELLHAGTPGEGLPWWRGEATVRIAPASEATLRLRPSAEQVGRWQRGKGPLPWLAGATLAAVLLGTLLHEVQRGQRLVSELESTNALLDERVRETAHKDREVQQLNRELEERVAARTADLDQLVRELEAFNHSVSHDLRSPIGAILNFSTILEEDYGGRLDETGEQILQRIRRSAHSALGLLDGLANLSRTSRQEVSLQWLDMEALIREAFASAAMEAGRSDAELDVGVLPEAFGDRNLVRRLLRNLIDNALKFSRPGIPVQVTASGRPEDGGVAFCIGDNGVGFDMKFAPKLFQAFRRLHGSDEFPGVGVGLAVVELIVRRHGGRVWAESEPGKGARFSFFLPHPRDERNEA